MKECRILFFFVWFFFRRRRPQDGGVSRKLKANTKAEEEKERASRQTIEHRGLGYKRNRFFKVKDYDMYEIYNLTLATRNFSMTVFRVKTFLRAAF